MTESRNSRLRTIDIARGAGYSVQQIRNLERDEVLPSSARSDAGHRIYGEVHLQSALAYRGLAAGVGPADAKTIVRAAHSYPESNVLALLDAAHTRLDTERRELAFTQAAAATIVTEPIEDVHPADALSIAELAGALGIRTSTLRHWDAEGLVVPDRSGARGPRRYSPAAVRDARIVHQLRLAGYGIAQLRRLLPQLVRARGRDDLAAILTARGESIDARSLALLDGAAALRSLITPTR
ncbi:MAG: MerR family transcriptional regulator [Rhodococcus sp. (in: high G+C Gram-positive bacteria)]|uniref:MerR family transcriptional regulator n=1 Tax=Rhodococcus sp. TaxID=1831 RepID=UPI003BB52943